VKAARTERDLEQERLGGALAEELRAGRSRALASQRPGLVALPDQPSDTTPADPLSGADVRGADPAHLVLIAGIVGAQAADMERRVEVLWVRSNATHAVWCERTTAARGATREVICVARIDGGAVVQRWFFD
jgi:hypothetical protein